MTIPIENLSVLLRLSSNGTKVIPVVIILVKVILTSILLCPKSGRAVGPASTPRSLFGPNPNSMCGFTIFCYRAFWEWLHILVKLHKRTCLCLLEIQNTSTLSRIKGLSKISLFHAILTPSILTLEVSHPDPECMFPPRIRLRLSPKCLPPDHWLSKSLPNCTYCFKKLIMRWGSPLLKCITCKILIIFLGKCG